MAARRSDCILTVSEASKRDILHFFNVPPEKIVVVYNAIDERFWVEPAPEDVARVRERYQLDHRFVLYAGNIKPHKNVDRLIEAFALLNARIAKRLDDDYPEFTEALFDVLYPHYLRPFPSCSIAHFGSGEIGRAHV